MVMEQRLLGQTGITIGKVGVSSSYGADCAVFEAAPERGCNYFNWGTFIRGRSKKFKTFMRVLANNGRRDRVVLGLISYSHSVFWGNRAVDSALRQLRTDYIDTLILGYFSRRPPQRLID
jgi:aryl-alcohol dehydrogenase-like predicted oxidoreductase